MILRPSEDLSFDLLPGDFVKDEVVIVGWLYNRLIGVRVDLRVLLVFDASAALPLELLL